MDFQIKQANLNCSSGLSTGVCHNIKFFLHLEDAVDDYGDDEDDITDLTDPMESLRAKLGQVSRPPQKFNVLEKFRYRSDKMIVRETFLLEDKVIER